MPAYSGGAIRGIVTPLLQMVALFHVGGFSHPYISQTPTGPDLAQHYISAIVVSLLTPPVCEVRVARTALLLIQYRPYGFRWIVRLRQPGGAPCRAPLPTVLAVHLGRRVQGPGSTLSTLQPAREASR